MLKVKLNKIVKISTKVCCLLLVVLLTGCTACSYKGYSGRYVDLYSVAINSLLWNWGHSAGAERYCDSEIEILEKDEFGRTMFTYYEKYYAGVTITFSSLIVSQYSSDGYVYYYEDANYLIKEQDLYSKLRKFSQEEIENLKAENDWGKAIDLKKCAKVKITRNKENIPTNIDTLKEKVVTKFNCTQNTNNIFMHYLTSDTNGNYIIYGVIRKFDESNIFFSALLSEDGSVIDWLVPQNPYDYQEELKSFKQKNGWLSCKAE